MGGIVTAREIAGPVPFEGRRNIMKNERSGFTLIEIMIVVIIIAALASMVTPYLMDIPDRAKAKIARGSIENIGVALKLYMLDTGRYPNDLNSLLSVPPGVAGRTSPYLESPPEDPWGSTFKYKFPGAHSKGGFDLWSIGPNKADDSGGNDDICNWKKE